jgi:hypothetical protein
MKSKRETLSTVTWQDIITNWTVAWSLCMEIVIRAIDSPDVAPAAILRRAYDLVADPPPAILGDPILWARFRWSRRLANVFFGEITGRLRDRPAAARALTVALLSPGSDSNQLEHAIRVQRVSLKNLRAYDDADPMEGDEDLRQTAIESTLQTYQHSGLRYGSRVPVRLKLASRRQFGLEELPGGRWNWEVFYREKIRRNLMTFGPLKHDEALTNAASEALHDHWKKQKTLGRSATSTALDYLVSFAAVAQGEADHLNSETALLWKEQLEQCDRMIRADRQGGPKAAVFFRAKLDFTDEKAAQIAGISRQTAHKYKVTFRRIFRHL